MWVRRLPRVRVGREPRLRPYRTAVRFRRRADRRGERKSDRGGDPLCRQRYRRFECVEVVSRRTLLIARFRWLVSRCSYTADRLSPANPQMGQVSARSVIVDLTSVGRSGQSIRRAVWHERRAVPTASGGAPSRRAGSVVAVSRWNAGIPYSEDDARSTQGRF